jgi:hypothetical protein
LNFIHAFEEAFIRQMDFHHRYFQYFDEITQARIVFDFEMKKNIYGSVNGTIGKDNCLLD